MERKNKSPLLAALIAVLISVGLVAVAVYATTTIGNDVSVGGDLTVGGNATTTGNQIISGTLTVTGITTLSDLTVTTVTSTNLIVNTSLTLPNNSVTDAMVVDGLTISGGTIDNTPIGASSASTGIFTNATTTGTLAVVGTSTLATTTATKLTVSGALEISEGALTDSTVLSVDIKDGEIVNADISANALISLSKLATSTSGYIIVVNASGVPSYVAMSGDVTISNTGATTIADNSITNAKMADDSIKQAELDYEVVTVDVVPAAFSGTTTVTSGAEILGYYPTTNDGKVVDSISISATTLTLTVNSTSTATSTFKVTLIKP